jgi:hypothetical protein
LKILFEKKGFHGGSGERRFARATFDCTTAPGEGEVVARADELLAV